MTRATDRKTTGSAIETGFRQIGDDMAIVGTATETSDSGIRVLIRPNHSLSPVATLMFMGGFAILTLIIAMVFVLQGYWPVLPFAGIEIAVVGAAFWYCGRKAQDYDMVTIEGDRVSVVQRRDNREQAHEFDRHWVRVELEAAERRMHAPRLMLGSHGKRIEIASALPEDGRKALAGRLKGWLAAGDGTPGAVQAD